MAHTSKLPLMAGAAGGVILVALAGVWAGRTVLAPAPKPVAAPAEAELHGPETLKIDAARLAASGIQLVTVDPGSLSAEVLAQGVVASPPDAEAVPGAQAAGAVVRITKRVGDPVAAGETLALIESRDGAGIAADRAAALARATAARTAYQRETRLFEARITARQDMEAAQTLLAVAEADLRRASAAMAAAHVTGDGRHVAVTSPIRGRVTEATAVLGAYVTAGTVLFKVADPARVEVHAAIPAADAPRVAAGDAAQVELADGATVAARVRSVSPALNDQTRSAEAVLSLDGAAVLTPGQGLRVRIRTKAQGGPSRLAAPDEAIQSVEGRQVVFVRQGDLFQVRPVVLGARGGGRTEVLSGLRAGESIAARGAFLLKAEMGAGEGGHEH